VVQWRWRKQRVATAASATILAQDCQHQQPFWLKICEMSSCGATATAGRRSQPATVSQGSGPWEPQHFGSSKHKSNAEHVLQMLPAMHATCNVESWNPGKAGTATLCEHIRFSMASGSCRST
jgi:hypothetical protein